MRTFLKMVCIRERKKSRIAKKITWKGTFVIDKLQSQYFRALHVVHLWVFNSHSTHTLQVQVSIVRLDFWFPAYLSLVTYFSYMIELRLLVCWLFSVWRADVLSPGGFHLKEHNLCLTRSHMLSCQILCFYKMESRHNLLSPEMSGKNRMMTTLTMFW